MEEGNRTLALTQWLTGIRRNQRKWNLLVFFPKTVLVFGSKKKKTKEIKNLERKYMKSR